MTNTSIELIYQNVKEIIHEALCTDGAHHKQWYLEQIALKLGIDLSAEQGTFEPGIAP